MNFRALPLLVTGFALFTAACSSSNSGGEHGPIVLGDTATIVTETDSQYLRDMVPDLQVVEPAATQPTEPAVAATVEKPEPPKEEPKAEKPIEEPVAAHKGNGLNADFGNVSVFFPNMKVRNADRSVKGANSVSYTLDGDAITSSKLQVIGGTVSRVQQRLQYGVIAKNAQGILALTTLGTENGPWQTLKGTNGQYTFAGQPKVRFNPSATAIRSAVEKAARAQRLSRRQQRDWTNAVKNVRSVTQSPLSVVLRTSIWKIEGTDAKGKRFTKEIRIDIPV